MEYLFMAGAMEGGDAPELDFPGLVVWGINRGYRGGEDGFPYILGFCSFTLFAQGTCKKNNSRDTSAYSGETKGVGLLLVGKISCKLLDSRIACSSKSMARSVVRIPIRDRVMGSNAS